MTAAIYIRKSREEEGKAAHRLQAQREQLPAHAEAQGWDVALYDDGYASAAKGKAELLPERTRLEADIRAGSINVVLCIELSRLSRDDTLQDYVRFLALCAEHAARLATPSRVLDPRESSDWMLLLLEGGFSSLEMRAITARLRQGRERAWEAGGHVGGAISEPYRKGGGPGILVVDPAAKDRVLQVLRTFAERGPVVAATLARGLGYHKNTLRRWVSDAGLNWFLARRPSLQRPGEWVACHWPAILSPDEAAAIRRARERTRHRTHRARTPSLLSGLRLLRCGYCGALVTGQSSGDGGPKRHYYLCTSGGWTDTCPRSRTVRRALLDHAVVTHVLGTLSQPDVLSARWAAASEGSDERTAALRAAENDLLARKARLVAAVETNTLDLADVGQRLREITAALEQVRADLRTAAEAEQAPDFGGLAETAEDWESLDFDERRELLAAAIAQVRLYRNWAVVTYALTPAGTPLKTSRLHLVRTQNQQKTRLRVVKGGAVST